MVSAHAADIAGGVEIELLVFGVAVLFLAVVFRPSKTGTLQHSIVTTLLGIALVAGAFIVPRV